MLQRKPLVFGIFLVVGLIGMVAMKMRPTVWHPVYFDPNQLEQVEGGKGFQPIPTGPGRSKHDGLWYGLTQPFQAFFFSAFYDDRKSLGSLPVVRIIAVTEPIEDERKLFCKIFYEGRKDVVVVEAEVALIGAGIIQYGRMFKESLVTCKLKDEDIPTTISITPTKEDQHLFSMPVEIPPRPDSKQNFVVCVSVTYWRHDPYRIVEWMELLREMGVSLVTIYNNSLTEDATRVFQYYDDTGFVDFRQSHNFVALEGEHTIHMHMSPVINDCMYRNMYSFKKIIVTDLDELIVPRDYYTYPELIVHLDHVYPTEHPARHYLFTNVYYFTDFPKQTDVSQKLTSLAYRIRLPQSETGYAAKSIIDPQACINMHNHVCWGNTALYGGDGYMVFVDGLLALNQHYKACHFTPTECTEQMKISGLDNIMLRYKDMLYKRMPPILKKLNLDPL